MNSEKVSESDRSTLSLLSGGEGQGHAPQSGEMLQDETSADLTAEKAKVDHKATQVSLVAAKKGEIAILAAKIETKLTRQGDLAVELESMKGGLCRDEEFPGR